MRVLHFFAALLSALLLLAIPSQVYAVVPHSTQIRSILMRSRPSYEGRLLNIISDLQLEGKLGHPFQVTEGKHTLAFDNRTCVGDVGDMTYTALKGVETLATMAESAAAFGSQRLFSHIFNSHARETRQKVAAHYGSILINVGELLARYESPPKHTITYYCTNHKPANGTINQGCSLRDTTAFVDGLKGNGTSVVISPAFYSCLPTYKDCDNEYAKDYTTLRELARVSDPKFPPPSKAEAMKNEESLQKLQRARVNEWQKLTPEQRLVSADSFEIYAHAVALLCPDSSDEMFRRLSLASSRKAS